ncbi:hypothetical protein QQ008_08010 [Fulvivirgaceae bacterium BMA10]|uniref:Secretion system C-terminal sorting domain-containing protein n=1 Tax=Splendidivirga corallicola TaxID=3051826 RepID=A0ABT8KKQ7_9BACT|nr:hypothetical protein [Fulvivirgaceae bacterium BMA10]
MKIKNVLKLAVIIGIIAPTVVYAGSNDNNGTNESETKVKLVSENENVFKLIYLSDLNGKVIVNIYDSKNKKIMTDRITNKDGFIRPYNFKELKNGVYRFELIDADGKIEKTAFYRMGTEPNARFSPSTQFVDSLEQKLELRVVGPRKDPIDITIYTNDGREFFKDRIREKNSISKVYDLHMLKAGKFTFLATHGNKVIAKKTFER